MNSKTYNVFHPQILYTRPNKHNFIYIELMLFPSFKSNNLRKYSLVNFLNKNNGCASNMTKSIKSLKFIQP